MKRIRFRVGAIMVAVLAVAGCQQASQAPKDTTPVAPSVVKKTEAAYVGTYQMMVSEDAKQAIRRSAPKIRAALRGPGKKFDVEDLIKDMEKIAAKSIVVIKSDGTYYESNEGKQGRSGTYQATGDILTLVETGDKTPSSQKMEWTFDARAKTLTRGEGTNRVVLKKM